MRRRKNILKIQDDFTETLSGLQNAREVKVMSFSNGAIPFSPFSPLPSLPLSAVLRPPLFPLFPARKKKKAEPEIFAPNHEWKAMRCFLPRKKKEKCSREKNFSLSLYLPLGLFWGCLSHTMERAAAGTSFCLPFPAPLFSGGFFQKCGAFTNEVPRDLQFTSFTVYLFENVLNINRTWDMPIFESHTAPPLLLFLHPGGQPTRLCRRWSKVFHPCLPCLISLPSCAIGDDPFLLLKGGEDGFMEQR